jgi:putative transcriptional regulator
MIKQGDLLLAPPNMPDQRFQNSVILLTKHTSRGSQGICLNRYTEHFVSEIIDPLGIDLDFDCEIFWGGPVSPTTVWMLHDHSWHRENTDIIDNHWAITSHSEMFHDLKNHRPQQFRLVIGQAIWGPGQLEAELRGQEPWRHDQSWLIVHDPDPQWLLDSDPDLIWQSACGISGRQAVESWL